jgi:hypothetical protein
MARCVPHPVKVTVIDNGNRGQVIVMVVMTTSGAVGHPGVVALLPPYSRQLKRSVVVHRTAGVASIYNSNEHHSSCLYWVFRVLSIRTTMHNTLTSVTGASIGQERTVLYLLALGSTLCLESFLSR